MDAEAQGGRLGPPLPAHRAVDPLGDLRREAEAGRPAPVRRRRRGRSRDQQAHRAEGVPAARESRHPSLRSRARHVRGVRGNVALPRLFRSPARRDAVDPAPARRVRPRAPRTARGRAPAGNDQSLGRRAESGHDSRRPPRAAVAGSRPQGCAASLRVQRTRRTAGVARRDRLVAHPARDGGVGGRDHRHERVAAGGVARRGLGARRRPHGVLRDPHLHRHPRVVHALRPRGPQRAVGGRVARSRDAPRGRRGTAVALLHVPGFPESDGPDDGRRVATGAQDWARACRLRRDRRFDLPRDAFRGRGAAEPLLAAPRAAASWWARSRRAS